MAPVSIVYMVEVLAVTVEMTEFLCGILQELLPWLYIILLKANSYESMIL